jgi:protein-tyrosine-phosphatase
LLRYKAGDKYEVRSAGLAAMDGMDASEYTKQVLEEKLGLTIEHCAQTVTPELVEWADMIITMTRSHADALKSCYPDRADTIHVFKELQVSAEQLLDISDPFGGPKSAYETTFHELEILIDRLLQE